ncbi:PIN domain-containing protein [Persephonella sp. KM09-Lau-8]|uniref:type II toxin-antitoxin system VapC family toxin n=1 Tax=Persephonella sp. KM09-Lau-8 TaxID=1158345 RepID=UPI0004970A31|nr:PIN domain-containing protein [Persephonella sp. KM09-Lau-8]
MKIFLDTNILLDLLLDRKNSYEASIILNSVDVGLFEGYISDITLVNINYIAKKQKKENEIKEFLILLLEAMEICTPDTNLIYEALKLENKDFEDNIQYLLAKKYKCDCLITNDKDLKFDDIEILDSKSFIDKYLR